MFLKKRHWLNGLTFTGLFQMNGLELIIIDYIICWMIIQLLWSIPLSLGRPLN